MSDDLKIQWIPPQPFVEKHMEKIGPNLYLTQKVMSLADFQAEYGQPSNKERKG